MASHPTTRGFRRIEDLPPKIGTFKADQVITFPQTRHLYKTLTTKDAKGTQEHWIRRIGRGLHEKQSTPVASVRTLSADHTKDLGNFNFIDSFISSPYGQHHQERASVFAEDPFKLARGAPTETSRWRTMSLLSDALTFCPPHQWKELLTKEITPIFFKLYPQGRIIVTMYDETFEGAFGMMRAAYAYSQGFRHEDAEQFSGFATLREWQAVTAPSLGRTLLEILNLLWYPKIAGFHSGFAFGLDLNFLFDPPEGYEPGPFPQSWLAIAKSHARFGAEAVDFRAIMQNLQGPEAQAAAHSRFLHNFNPSAEQQSSLAEYLLSKFSHLIYELTDLTNFTKDCGPMRPIDPVFAFEHALTVDRLFRLTLRAMSLDEVSAAKTTVFDVADLYDSLSETFQNTPQGSTKFFKLFFNPREAPKKLCPILQQLPEPFGSKLSQLCSETYKTLESTITKSVWLPSLNLPGGKIGVRSRDLTRIDSEDPGTFVGNVMRALRNSHHGYFTVLDKGQTGSSRYLWPIDGNIPDALTALPPLWLIAYLLDPKLVGWKQLEAMHYE